MATLSLEAGWTEVRNVAVATSYTNAVTGFNQTPDATPSFTTSGGSTAFLIAIEFAEPPDLVIKSGFTQLKNAQAGSTYSRVLSGFKASGDTTPSFTTTGGTTTALVGIEFAGAPALSIESGWTQITNAPVWTSYGAAITGFNPAGDTTPSFTTDKGGTAFVVGIEFKAAAVSFVTATFNGTDDSDTLASSATITTPVDSNWANVTALLHFNEVGSAPVDQIAANAWSLNGTASISSTSPIFGAGSLVTDASDGSMAQTTNVPANWNFGTGDFTVELALNLGTTQANEFPVPIEVGDGNSNVIWQFYFDNNYFGSYNAYWWTPTINIGSSSVNTPYWDGATHYLAYSRVAGVGSLYVDGVRVGTGPDAVNYMGGSILTVGKASTGYNQCAAKFDEVRITKGVGRYTGTGYTLQTSEFPAGVPLSAVTTALNVTDDADTLTGTANVAVAATSSRTDDNDVLAASATARVAVVLSVNDGADTASATAQLGVSAALSVNDGDDALTASAVIGNPPVDAAVNVTDDTDFASSAVAALITAALSAVDEADTVASAALASVFANLSINDDDDALVASTTTGSTINLDVTDAQDGMSASTVSSITALLNLTDDADTLSTAMLVGPARRVGGDDAWMVPSQKRTDDKRLEELARARKERMREAEEALFGKPEADVQEAVAAELAQIAIEQSMLAELLAASAEAEAMFQDFIAEVQAMQERLLAQEAARQQAIWDEEVAILMAVAKSRLGKNRLALALGR